MAEDLLYDADVAPCSINRVAAEIAPKELTGRPAALRLVRDILATAPISVRREAREYAATLGVHA